MMRCRTGTAQSSGAFPLKACGGPGSAAHRFAHACVEIMKALVYALALRRIRDTGRGPLPFTRIKNARTQAPSKKIIGSSP
jgi:hypothetical protein